MAEPKAALFVTPPRDQGAFVASSAAGVALSNQYPSDGAGTTVANANGSIWTQNELGDGEFEIELTFVSVAASTVLKIDQPDGLAGEVHYFPAGMSETCLRITGPMRLSKSTGTGAIVVGFRINKFRKNKV